MYYMNIHFQEPNYSPLPVATMRPGIGGIGPSEIGIPDHECNYKLANALFRHAFVREIEWAVNTVL